MKKFVTATLALMLVLVLGTNVCAAFAQEKPKDTITVAILVGAITEDKLDDVPLMKWVKKAIETWEYSDTIEVVIEPVYARLSDYLTKMALEMSAANTCPDLIWEDSFQLTADVAAGYIADISEYVNGWEQWNGANFTEAVKASVAVGDGIYGVPATTDTRGLIYNKNVMIQAGIIESYEDEWQPDSWESLLNDLRTIKSNCPGVIPFWSCMSAGEGEGTVMHNFENWFYGTGEELTYENDTQWNFDGKAWEDSVTALATIIAEELTMPTAELLDAKPNNYARTYLKDNKMGVILNNCSVIKNFAPGASYEMEGDYTQQLGLAAMPSQFGGDPAYCSMSGGLLWAIPELSDAKDQAFLFLTHLMETETYCDFIVDYGALSVMDLSAYPAYTEQPFNQKATSFVEFTHFRPHSEDYSAVSICIYQMIEAISTGSSVEDALATFRSDAAFAINN